MNKKKDKIFSKWAKKFSVVTELFSKWAKTRCGRRDTTTTIKKKKKTSCCSVVDLKPCHGWGWYIGCGSVGDVQLGRVRRIGYGSVVEVQLCRFSDKNSLWPVLYNTYHKEKNPYKKQNCCSVVDLKPCH